MLYAYTVSTISSLNGQLSSDRLYINKKTYYNSSNSAFWGWLSMESQPQNTEFRNNPENLHPCSSSIWNIWPKTKWHSILISNETQPQKPDLGIKYQLHGFALIFVVSQPQNPKFRHTPERKFSHQYMASVYRVHTGKYE